MCKFSNMTTSNNVKKASGNCVTRVNGPNLHSLAQTKNVVEDISVELEGDIGTDGRPRVREVVKIPPQYESIDLLDPNEAVLF